MKDTYVELLVKKPKNKKKQRRKNITMSLAIAFLMVGLFGSTFLTMAVGCLLLALIFFLISFFGCRGVWIEYEYLYLDKELTIDQIRDQAKRKNAAAYRLGSLVVMAPAGSARVAEYDSLPTVDYSSEDEAGQPYILVFEAGGQKTKLKLDTTPELVDAMRLGAPRAVFKN